MAIVDLSTVKNNNIKVDVLKSNVVKRKLSPSAISQAKDEIEWDVAIDHSSDPIKSLNDIERISKFLISNNRYRDNMLFIVGINFGLRASDLRRLRFANLINENLTFKDSFAILEKKTANTRKRKKNRYITINDAVIESVTLYLENTNNIRLDHYMFRSESNNGKNKNEPMTVRGIEYMLKRVCADLDLNIHMATHTLRKTFAYHQMVMSGNDPRKLLLLQKMFGHSSSMQTLDYIGITSEEIEDAYKSLNLGSANHYFAGSDIIEFDNIANG